MDRRSRTEPSGGPRAGGLTAALVAAAACCPAQTFQRGPTRSPHGALKIPCGSCHTATSWTPLRNLPEFNHYAETHFALRGMHEAVECRLCHTRPVFTNVGAKCADCHADIHRRQFGARCDGCHTVKGWRVAVQAVREHQNRFPLLGAHATLECESCHRGAAAAQFAGLAADCGSCHRKDYQQARTLDHQAARLPATCEMCHSMDTWHSAKFDHTAFARFPLEGAHARLDCVSCHVGGRFQATASDCYSCHAREFSSTRNPDHAAAGFSHDCRTCHTTANWQGARFDHNTQTRFALTGAHQRADCASCHRSGQFAGTATDCFGCHASNFQAAKNPDHTRASFSTQCSQCHATDRWQGARFDHNITRFPLTGAHGRVECSQCHTGGRYSGLAAECSACHLEAFRAAREPNHVAAGFPQDCTTCHTTAQWKGARFDHNAATKFALTGAHVQASCNQCHAGNRFAGTSSQCGSCHLEAYQKTSSPNHAAAGFSQECGACHTTAQWQGAVFDHGKTKFPLAGAHTRVECAQCHTGNRYAGSVTQCAGCHLPAFQRTTNPNHAAAGFPQDCAVCHTTVQWQGAVFDHGKTKFPLAGAHTRVECAQCHVNNRFAGTASQCSACHLPAFQHTTNPNHTAAGFPQDCAVCHTTVQWQGAVFDHGKTKFPLAGAHTRVECAQCHTGNRYAGTVTQCAGCHLPAFQHTTNPNHTAAGFPQDCAVCHTTVQWSGARFDHNTATKFALTGAHLRVTCNQCHVGNRFAGTASQCSGCHLPVFQRTTNPNHAAAGFPQDCSICHTTTQWLGARFDHSRTSFPLTGAHVPLQCSSCHAGGRYAGLDAACVSCHLAAYQRTTNPNHAAAGFPQQCNVCHSATAWRPASFNHSATRFPLTGAHANVQCARCHVGGRYAGTPTDCYSCHTTVYQTVTNPNHVAAGFPRDCALCHTTTTWTGARFNHRFPIYTGAHAGKWTTCNDCHTNPSNYAVFACTVCHEHSKTRMDEKHTGVRNYVYNSANCYACHPQGRE